MPAFYNLSVVVAIILLLKVLHFNHNLAYFIKINIVPLLGCGQYNWQVAKVLMFQVLAYHSKLLL